MEENLKRGEEDHEQSAPLRLGKGPRGPAQCRGKDDLYATAAEALQGRPRPVGRQLQNGGPLELRLPVDELGREHVVAQPVALPAREVGVLYREVGER